MRGWRTLAGVDLLPVSGNKFDALPTSPFLCEEASLRRESAALEGEVEREKQDTSELRQQ